MADISIRGFDGQAGGPVGGGANIVSPQPDFANMTLEELQAWEAANNTNPLTGAAPASAEVPLHVDERTAEAAETPTLSLVGGGPAYDPNANAGEAQQELVHAEFSLGEPFVHLVAYLTQGPVEIVATPAEALDIYNKLGLALGAAQRAGVIQ